MLLIRILLTLSAAIVGLFASGFLTALFAMSFISEDAFDRAFKSWPLGLLALSSIIFYLICAALAAFFVWRASAGWIKRMLNWQLIDSENIYSERGGGRYGAINVSWPLARLFADRTKLEIKVLGSTFNFDQSQGQLLLCRGLTSRGLKVFTPQSSVIFWSLDIQRLATKLRALGYDVHG